MAFEPKRASDLLRSVLESVQTKSSRGVFQRALEGSLDATQIPHGTEQAGREGTACEVLGFRGGVLHVEVASAPLFAELSSFHRETLRAAMNERLEKHAVAKIVFRMSGTGRS